MLIDFRKALTVISDLFIDGVKVEGVTEYKYLGIVFDNKVNFNKNTNLIHKSCQPRIFCLQKLRSFMPVLLFYIFSARVVTSFNIFVSVLV